MYFFTAIGSEDIISIVHMYLAFFRFQLLDSRYVPTVLVQLIQKILKVLNSCTKRKLHEQESRTTQFRVPPWKPDGLGAPGSYRVELVGVTPLLQMSNLLRLVIGMNGWPSNSNYTLHCHWSAFKTTTGHFR